jgi:PAS domain S-box-containing protein
VICVPLHKDGVLTAAMAVHQKTPRHWTPAEVELVTTVVGRCWEALERSRVARVLQESESRYRAIVEASPECVKLVAPDGTLLQMNEAGLAMVEGDESALGQCVYNLIAPEYREAYRQFNERVCRGERGALEFDIIGLKGTRRHMETTAVPLPAPQGGFTQLAVTRDITSRVRDAASLREKEARLKLLVENTKDYAVVISDPQGTILEWQGAAERITGYSPGEAVGRGPDLLFTPEDRAAGQPLIEVAKAERDGRAEDKRWHMRKDGTRFYADGVMTALYDGKLHGFGKVFKDATREKQAEEATRRRAFQLQKLADIASRISAAHDVSSVIGVVTEEARHLVGARQAATSMVLDPNHPQPINVISNSDDGSARTASPAIDALAFYEAVNRANEPIRLTRNEIGTNPTWQAMRQLAGVGPSPKGWLAAPMVGRNGRNMGLIQLSDRFDGEFTEDDEAILVQLSQLAAIAIENARLYEELRANDERKDEFLAMLAHELRNPLAAINNAVKLTSRADAREHIDWSMEVITRQMQHLSRLIDDLMDVSRITRGKIELRRDVLEATPILESAAATVKALVEERKHTLDLDIERGALWVNVDPTRLEQVVVNLLNNAAKYSENAGQILLSARNEAGEVVISVKDRGVGIPPEKLPEMFELFAQGDRSLARSEGGLGIGLTIVKKLVEMHGGTISATSEGLGKGSEFIIRLPASSRPSELRPLASATELQASKKARILVVDDNVDTARGMARLLKLLGHEVATAHSGQEAIEVARAHQQDFILLDIGLPGMSGYEVASQLRKEECCREAVIVAISGYGQEEDRRRSKEAGFDYHLVKPLDHDALLTLLANGSNGRA